MGGIIRIIMGIAGAFLFASAAYAVGFPAGYGIVGGVVLGAAIAIGLLSLFARLAIFGMIGWSIAVVYGGQPKVRVPVNALAQYFPIPDSPDPIYPKQSTAPAKAPASKASAKKEAATTPALSSNRPAVQATPQDQPKLTTAERIKALQALEKLCAAKRIDAKTCDASRRKLLRS